MGFCKEKCITNKDKKQIPLLRISRCALKMVSDFMPGFTWIKYEFMLYDGEAKNSQDSTENVNRPI